MINLSTILPILLFWAAFAFSVGPFWISIMQVVNHQPFKTVVFNYLIYLIFSWFIQIMLIALVMNWLGEINIWILISLHLFGSLVIFYLCYKIVISKIKKVELFNFDFKQMSLLSWSNPKVWVMIPIGSISAQISDSIWFNSLLFYLSGVPLFIAGFLLWSFLGKLGGKLSLNAFSYINASMLAIFSLYILYQGLVLLVENL